jgi:hypothetical protein
VHVFTYLLFFTCSKMRTILVCDVCDVSRAFLQDFLMYADIKVIEKRPRNVANVASKKLRV